MDEQMHKTEHTYTYSNTVHENTKKKKKWFSKTKTNGGWNTVIVKLLICLFEPRNSNDKTTYASQYDVVFCLWLSLYALYTFMQTCKIHGITIDGETFTQNQQQ